MRTHLLLFLFSCIVCNAQTFVQEQKIKAEYQFAGNNFGNSIDITDDLMIVGDPQDYHDASGAFTTQRSGSVHIYRKDNAGIWQFEQRFVHPIRLNEASYGYEVEIENNIAVVSAIFGIEGSFGDAGRVFIYQYDANSGIWSLIQEIVAPTRQTGAQFGTDFSLQGNTLIIGEPFQQLDPNDTAMPPTLISGAGVVHIYNFDATTNNFVLDHSITAPVRSNTGAFGFGLDVDGDKLVVGESRKAVTLNGNNYNSHGEAHFFKRDVNGIFQFVQTIENLEEKAGMEFGHTISLDEDLLAISAPFEDLPIQPSGTNFDQGEVYLYKYNSSTNQYDFTEAVTSTNTDANWFGFDTDLENGKLVVSSYQDRFITPLSTFPFEIGAFWYFEIDSQGLVNQSNFHTIFNDNANNFASEFSYSVALSGDFVAVGAPDDEFDLNQTNTGSEAGAVFIYKIDNATASNDDFLQNTITVTNPITDRIKIFGLTKDSRFILYNLDGKLLKSGMLDTSNPEINTNWLSSGIYILAIESNMKKQRFKVIKK